MLPVDPAATTLCASGNETIGLLGTLHLVGHKNFLGTGKNGLDLTYSNLTLEVKGRTATLATDYAVTGVVGGKAGNEVDATGTAEPLVTFTTTAFTPGTDLTLNDADTYAASGLVIGVLAALGLVTAGIVAGIGALTPNFLPGVVETELKLAA